MTMDLNLHSRIAALEEFIRSQVNLNRDLKFANDAYAQILYANDFHEITCDRYEGQLNGMQRATPDDRADIACTCLMRPVDVVVTGE